MRAKGPVIPASNADGRKHMGRRLLMASVAFALTTASSLGQSQQPYVGLEARAIKALSEQQIADLRAGRGMGLALAAELNGYPGPMHVLELGDSLGLSEKQRGKMEELLTAMKAEAIPLGERLLTQEAYLDRQFANKTITSASLAAVTDAIGATQAALRRTHLKYHLLARDVLTPAQVQRYAELRGYKAGMQHPHGRQ